MRAEQMQPPASARSDAKFPHDARDVESLELLIQQKYAVEQASGKGQKMLENIAQIAAAAKHTAKIISRSTDGRGRRRQEIQTDRIEKQPRRAPAEAQRDPDPEPIDFSDPRSALRAIPAQ